MKKPLSRDRAKKLFKAMRRILVARFAKIPDVNNRQFTMFTVSK